ncbi:hypothetical protein KEM56_006102 [Ascosphaera pollenicola]|nr:hypothetical protein KEM56_006102 [Ascosphaera pollenicola]
MRCHQNSELLRKHRKHEEYIKNNVFNPAINKDLSRENAWLEYVAKVQRGEISDDDTPPPVKKPRLAPTSSNVRPDNATRFRVRKSPPNGGLPSCFIKPKNWNRCAAAAKEQEARRAREQEANRAREQEAQRAKKLEAKRAKEKLEDKRANEILEEQRANFASDNNIKRMLGLEIRPPRRKAIPAAASALNAAAATATIAQIQRKTAEKQQNEAKKGPESRPGYRPVNPGNVTSGTATKPKPKTVFMECMEIIERQAAARSFKQPRW